MTERRESVLWVERMTCGSCVRRVGDALRALPDVEVIEIRREDGRVLVRHPAEGSVGAMIEALRDAGYESRHAA